MVSLDHIGIIISAEQNLEFYKKLGFEEEKRFERDYDKVIFMRCGEIVLEIFVDPRHPERMSSPEAMGLRHMALVVEQIESLPLEIGEIKTDWFGRRFTFVKDPDGQPIELKER